MSDTRKVPPSRHAIRFFSVPLRYRAFQPECGELMSVRAPGADSADEKASRKSFTHSKYSGVFSCAATRLGCSARPKSDDVLFGTSTRLLGRNDGYIWVPSTKAMVLWQTTFKMQRKHRFPIPSICSNSILGKKVGR